MKQTYQAPTSDPFICNRCGHVRTGDEFYWPGGRRNRWCKSCYREWHRGRYPVTHSDEPRACRQCGSSYSPGNRRESFYCSRDCKDRARKDADIAARITSKSARSCLWCGGRIGPERRIDAAYCSAICNSKAHSRTRNYHRRMGVRIKPRKDPLISLIDIAQRSRWRCGLCGKRVRPSLPHPDPMAPSIDHIIPLAKGGTNEPGNTQLAHLVCNLRKRAEMA